MLNIHLYHHPDKELSEKLTDIFDQLYHLNQKLTKIMATLTDLQNEVAAENTVIDSAITLLNGLTAQVAALTPAMIYESTQDIKGAKPTSLVVIETAEEWGLSFDGHNPEQESYFKMSDKETAFRLKEKLSAKFPPITRNSPLSSPSDKL